MTKKISIPALGTIFLILVITIVLITLSEQKEVSAARRFSGDVIFLSNSNNQGNIKKFDSKNKKLISLTTGKKYYNNVIWSPDGKKVAFTTSEDGLWKTYIMNIDGTDTRTVKGTTPLDTVWGWGCRYRKLCQ